MDRLLLNCVPSDPYVDTALVEGRAPRPREPRFVDVNAEMSGNVTARTSLAALSDRNVL